MCVCENHTTPSRVLEKIKHNFDTMMKCMREYKEETIGDKESKRKRENAGN